MKQFKILLLSVAIVSCLVLVSHARVAIIAQQVDGMIVSVSRKGVILTSAGGSYLSNSSELLKKANRLKNIPVRIIYFEQEGKNYCLDVESGTSRSDSSQFQDRRVVPAKQSNK